MCRTNSSSNLLYCTDDESEIGVLRLRSVCLEHLNDLDEAVKVVKATRSLDGARLVARHYMRAQDFAAAIQFLVVSRCNDEAFRLAQQHQKMQIYADVIGVRTTKHTACVNSYRGLTSVSVPKLLPDVIIICNFVFIGFHVR